MKTLDEVIKALQKNADREMARWNEETCFISEENLLDALLYLKEYRAELAQNSGELGNDPLTWDELRQMEGKPVWSSNNGHWYLVDCVETEPDGSNERIILTNKGRAQMPYDADDLIRFPLYRMKVL